MHFSTLRLANKLRLPIFKNKHGVKAHARHDGSDWDFATWFAATVGELGEVAMCRRRYDNGEIDTETYTRDIAHEFADVVTYVDIMALRALDSRASTFNNNYESEQEILLELMGHLGSYANAWKKMVRGDLSPRQYEDFTHVVLKNATITLARLKNASRSYPVAAYLADPNGINLENAVRQKYNIVSMRVGAGAPTIEQSSIGSDLIGWVSK